MNLKKRTESDILTDILIMLLVMAAMSFYYYGIRALMILAVTTSVCVVSDFICIKMRGRNISKDLSTIVTGLTLGLMMSVAVPYYIAAIASVFAIVIVKHAFGGHGCEIFNSAAVGFLFTALCFPENMLKYPKAFSYLPISSVVPENMLYDSMNKSMLMMGTSDISLIDTLIGKFYGPMGAGFVILLIIAAVFLMLRRSLSAITFFTEFVLLSLYALVYYDFNLMSVLYFFSGGMLLFGMIFISGDYCTVPKNRISRLIYGLIFSISVMLFHSYSSTENAVIYAAIIAAPFTIELDRKAFPFADMLKKRKFLVNNEPLNHINETLEILEKNEKES